VFVLPARFGAPLPPADLALMASKSVFEVVAAFYGLAFALSAIAYLVMRVKAPPIAAAAAAPRVAVVYLCCGDADPRALESLVALRTDGPLSMIIHDDSRDHRDQIVVDALATSLRTAREWNVTVLRRPEKSGGKPGAVNYVLEQTGDQYEYFLLCDNDSTVIDADAIPLALHRMAHDPRTAIVQFRTVAVPVESYCGINRLLSRSISAFDAFLAPAFRFGWMPFIGHNALLRTSSVREVGGLTPGFFSDDLDLTVRLNLRGYRVVYAHNIRMGETHPPSYEAFRRRSYKWAFGCVQTLKAHALSVLATRRLSLAEKASFLQFAGFYALQSSLLLYLAIAFVLTPWLMPSSGHVTDLPLMLISGTVVVLLIFLPVLAYVLKERGGWRWIGSLLMFGLVYGGTDFSVARGVLDGLLGRRRTWTPTNVSGSRRSQLSLVAEAAFGMLLLFGPLAKLPALLYLPCSYLFAGKFLFAPALALLYQDDVEERSTDLALVLDRQSVHSLRAGRI
jgi:cellulose synthase/poly-beta-1,6-N-acetylglucosamine synthase-like glycosyltransferase